jgi:hypothetical protein
MSEQTPEGETLFALVRGRYGDRLTPAELEEVRKGVEASVTAMRSLRAAKVEASDEPFPPFVPYRASS